jgi:UDP-N-acetylglucosamine 2-epimerase (non-hydrolysing)
LKVFLIAGARPNFMKIAPIYRESLKYDRVESKLIHTGQHYDREMSQVFFEELEIPKPDFFLSAGSASHAVQTARIMVAFEELCREEKPDLVLVVGDVNSTLACSIVAKKQLLTVAHVEAGLRSFDMTMPEEINRIVTDAISDYLFVTEESGIKNLLKEGRHEDRIHFVGNVMIDNLFYHLRKLEKEDPRKFLTHGYKKKNDGYVFLTLHRPSNVDYKRNLVEIVSAINCIADERVVFFPAHPRTRKMLEQFDINLSKNVILLQPLGFKESLFLWNDADLVMTDSGGLQEETTALGVPCLTLRDNTERPVTIDLGTNILAGTSKDSILEAYKSNLEKRNNQHTALIKWDGKASERIWKILSDEF